MKKWKKFDIPEYFIRQLYILDYLFKFDYKDRFRCISNEPRNDYFYTDAFNGAENEDLNDIKSKISTTKIIFNNISQDINNDNKDTKNIDKNKNCQILIKANIRGNILAIVVSDDLDNSNILNVNTKLIFFMTETYKFSQKTIVDIIGKKLLSNKVKKDPFLR